MSFLRTHGVLLGCGGLIEGAFVALLLPAMESGAQALSLWLALVPIGIGYGIALWHIHRQSANRVPGETSGTAVILIAAWAVLFRLTALFGEPSLSDDVYRYVWDGRVQLAGLNPYSFPPSSPELTFLRDDEIYPEINHKQIPTIYPPLAQLFFRLVCSVHASVGAMKIFLTLCEVGLIFIVIAMLERRHCDRRRALIYAWHPLPVIEVAGNGHLEALGVALLMLSLLWVVGDRRHAAAIALAAAVSSKLLPLLALPVVWREFGRHRSTLRGWLHPAGRLALLWLPALVGLGYAAYGAAGAGMVEGLRIYLLKWRFNDSLFSVINEALVSGGAAENDMALMTARWISSLALVAISLWVSARVADPLRAVFFIMGAYLLLTPTVHPWYVLWLLPFLPLFPHPAGLLFSWLVFLAYHVLDRYRSDGVWMEEPWVRWSEYGPVFLALLLPLAHYFLRRGPVRESASETP